MTRLDQHLAVAHLEELAPGPAVTRLGSHRVTDLVEELALDSSIVDEWCVVHIRVRAAVATMLRLGLLIGLGHVDDLLGLVALLLASRLSVVLVTAIVAL